MGWRSEEKQAGQGLSRLLVAGVVASVIGLGGTAGSAWAQQAQASSPVVLEHVRLFDGTGAAEQDDMAVLVQGSRIVSVGHTGKLAVPKGAKRIDLSGKTLIPGLISNHSHVGVVSGTPSGLKTLRHPLSKGRWTSMNAMA